MESRLVIKTGSMNWRDGPQYYHKERYQYLPGAVNFALAWFQQGHKVSPIFHIYKLSDL